MNDMERNNGSARMARLVLHRCHRSKGRRQVEGKIKAGKSKFVTLDGFCHSFSLNIVER